jgi:hypothetical protein
MQTATGCVVPSQRLVSPAVRISIDVSALKKTVPILRATQNATGTIGTVAEFKRGLQSPQAYFSGKGLDPE